MSEASDSNDLARLGELHYNLELPLMSALECLLVNGEVRGTEANIGEACLWLLDKYTPTKIANKNFVVGVLGLVPRLDNATANQLAYKALLTVLPLQDQGGRLTYCSLRYGEYTIPASSRPAFNSPLSDVSPRPSRR